MGSSQANISNALYALPSKAPLSEWTYPADAQTILTRQLLQRWVVAFHPEARVRKCITIAGVPTSILVRLPEKGHEVALCYVARKLDVTHWQEQHAVLEAAQVAGVWIFPPRPRHFKEAHPSSPPTGGADGLIVDTEIFKTMRREGSWPLIIDVEHERIANLIVPKGKIAARLDLQPPCFREGVLHVVGKPLSECRLCEDGIVTPAVNAGDLKAIRGKYGNNRRRPKTRPSQGDQQLRLVANPEI